MEALIMSVTIELIVEAGLRMPTGIGQIIGIVGGLVIGDAVVQAGLISNLMIITIALTTVSAFLVPNNEMNNAVRLLRFTFTFAASVLGFYGLMLLFLFMVAHMCRLTSLDEPYFSLGRLFDPKRASSAFVRSHATDGTKRGTGS
jgi:spore germination protein KA